MPSHLFTKGELQERFAIWWKGGSQEAEALYRLGEIFGRERIAVVGGTPLGVLLGVPIKDLDVITLGVPKKERKHLLREFPSTPNALGGLKYTLPVRLPLDLWEVTETRGYSKGPETPGFHDYPPLASFNLDTIVVRVSDWQVYERGFFDALNERTLEMNYREVTFPSLDLLRAHQKKAQFGFKFGPKLEAYLSEVAPRYTPDQIAALQQKRGGYSFTKENFLSWGCSLREQGG